MEKKNCYGCGKEKLSKSEVGLTKKLLAGDAECFYCLDCLAEYLEVDTELLLTKLQEFKEQGCELFS